MRKVLLGSTLATAMAALASSAFAIDVGVSASSGASASAGGSSFGGSGGNAGGSVSAVASISARSGGSLFSGPSSSRVEGHLQTRAGAALTAGGNIGVAADGTADGILNAAVVTLDGAVVGRVTNVQAESGGESFIIAAVNESFVSEPSGFRISTDAAIFFDEQVQIRMTEADLRASLQAQANANASANVN